MNMQPLFTGIVMRMQAMQLTFMSLNFPKQDENWRDLSIIMNFLNLFFFFYM